MPTWLLYALLSAAAAAFVGIFGKLGMKEVDSTVATVIRSIIMTAFLLVVGLATQPLSKLQTLHGKALLAIALSGIAGAISWLFYFKAIQVGTVAQIAPIDKLSMPLAVILAVVILGDRPSGWNWLGIAMIACGAYFAAWQPPPVVK